MDNLDIPATERSPAVAFDFAQQHLRISGESYPEDVAGFYRPVFDGARRLSGGARQRQLPLRLRADLSQQLERQGDHDADGQARRSGR